MRSELYTLGMKVKKFGGQHFSSAVINSVIIVDSFSNRGLPHYIMLLNVNLNIHVHHHESDYLAVDFIHINILLLCRARHRSFYRQIQKYGL